MNPVQDITKIEVTSGTIIRTIMIVIFFVAMFILRDLILVVLTAVVIAAAVEPMVKWFGQWKISRLPAVVLIYLGLALIIAATFYFVLLPLLNETSEFLNELPNYVGSLNLWSPISGNEFLSSQSVVKDFSDSFSLEKIVSGINSAAANISGGLVNTISTIFGGLLSFALIVVLSFYLAVQEDGIGTFLKTIIPQKHRSYATDLWKRAQGKIGLWMQGQLMLAVIVAVLVFLGLTLLGIKHALILAFLAGLFELIPVFGPILSAIPAVLLAFADQGLTMGLIVVGFYVIVQQFENHLIYPLVVRKVTGVSPIIAILALIIGGKLAGFLGIILSVPIATIILELFHDRQKGATAQESNSPKS